MPDLIDQSIESRSPAQTEELAIALAQTLSGGTVIRLSGELGAGKTVFVRGLAKGLKMPPGVAVTSPTYVLQHAYRGGRLNLYHIDAYRMMGGAAEFEGSGLRECLDDPAGVVCVEWPERLADFQWPNLSIDVKLEHLDEQTRRVTISNKRD